MQEEFLITFKTFINLNVYYMLSIETRLLQKNIIT